jgi:hypothetical protein
VEGVLSDLQAQHLRDEMKIKKQHEELQLLVIEIQARDKELNDMSVSHSRQKDSWVSSHHISISRLFTLS